MAIPQILLVEDEAVTRHSLKGIFEGEGYQVFEASNGDEMAQILENNTINLVVMDINLPGKNGLLLGRELREKTMLPLIFLTGRNNEIDKILGLEIGADDYLTKPFNPRELTIKTRNLLLRTMKNLDDENEQEIAYYRFHQWALDLNSHHLISPQGEQIKLPRGEFRALLQFCENPGKLQTREDLLKKMTGRPFRTQDRTVDVTVRRIRRHFENDPNISELIATIHGEGYRFCAEVETIYS